ncbi:M15 family metallopeptidase [Croceiramulus getboli]|nr:M15 family metallopeptidase [Flavobacteriaceae bacterium YJPT1-3]
MKTYVSLHFFIALLITMNSMYAQQASELPPEVELYGQGDPDLTSGDGYRLRPEAAVAFEQMKAAALKDSIRIQVVSSFRDYAHQNRIWERKYKRFRESGLRPQESIEKIIEYSTIPGTSRHHWGTDIDLIDGNADTTGDVLVPSKFHGKGPFCKFLEWMKKHSEEYGFYLVYTDNYNRKGFHYEPWHYSYRPLSKPYLDAYKKLDLLQKLEEAELMGSEHFTQEFMKRYIEQNILNINPDLL